MKKRIFIGIAAFFLALNISGYFIMTSAFAMEKIRAVVKSTLQEQLKREVSVGEITGNPFRGISIDGISVAKNDTLSEGKLAEIQTIKVNYSLIKLIRLKIVVDNIKIIQPKIWVEMDKDGKLNIPEFAQSSKQSKSSFILVLSNAEVSSGTVNFDDKRDSVQLTVDGINGSISGVEENKEVKYTGGGKAVKAELSLLKVVKHISDMEASFGMAGNVIKLSSLGLKMGDSVLSAKGEVLNEKVPKINIQVQAKLALNDLKEFAPQLKRIGGMVDINILANGELTDISGMCKINSENLYVNDLKVKDVKGKANFSQKGAELSSLSAN